MLYVSHSLAAYIRNGWNKDVVNPENCQDATFTFSFLIPEDIWVAWFLKLFTKSVCLYLPIFVCPDPCEQLLEW